MKKFWMVVFAAAVFAAGLSAPSAHACGGGDGKTHAEGGESAGK